jgi:hypothetical protein
MSTVTYSQFQTHKLLKTNDFIFNFKFYSKTYLSVNQIEMWLFIVLMLPFSVNIHSFAVDVVM